MLAIETILGIAAVVAFASLVTRGGGGGDEIPCDDAPGDEGCGELPGPDAWCDVLESALGVPTLCFDGSMRLRAAGGLARELVRTTPGQGGAHLFDLAPPEAARELVAIIAGARRGTPGTGRIAWGDLRMEAGAIPLIGGWTAVSLRPAEEVRDAD